MEKATELKYLKWFWCNADFGPADYDARIALDEQFRLDTGEDVPSGYRIDEE